MTERRQFRINDHVRIKFGIECYRRGMIENKKYIVQPLEKLMEKYIEGEYDNIFPNVLTKPKMEKKGMASLNRKLKGDFEDRAFDKGLIPHPAHGVWVMEFLMDKFNKKEIEL